MKNFISVVFFSCLLFVSFMSVVLISVISGCTPSLHKEASVIYREQKQSNYPLKVAVVEHPEFINYVYYDHNSNSKLKIGSSLSKNFHRKFPLLFEQISFLENYPSTEDYDAIIIPQIYSVSIPDIKECAESKRLRKTFKDWCGEVTIAFGLVVKDKQGNVLIETSGTSRNEGLIASGLKNRNYLKKITISTIINRAANRGIFSSLIAQAESEAFDQIITEIKSSDKLAVYANSVNILKTAPSRLIAKIQYSDRFSLIPNNTIDAGEQVTIIATITNNGKGTAFDVNLSAESNYKNIQFPKTISVGDIQPGGSKNVTIPIKADLSLSTGTANFLVKAREKRGYDARPVELQIPTAELRSPKLLFASCNLNDSSGLANGDGDGVAENNETIELNPYINNDGVGDALKVSVKLIDVTQGIEITKGNDQLASIGAGTIGKATLAFKIPRTFCQPEIKYTIAATDVRGMQIEQTYIVPFESKIPVLYYTYQVVDTRNREIPGLENGKSYSLRITPKNTGSNIAEGVKVRVSPESSKIIVGSYNGNVGRLQPDSVGPVITVPISLNRSFVDNALSLNVAMEQESFSGLSKNITLPVMVKKPELQYQTILLNGISDNTVSQNSWPRFRVSVSNNGSLDAKDVGIGFYVADTGIAFDKEEMIGTIKAGESQYRDFTFFVRGDAPVGEMLVKVRITQADFDDISTTIAYRLTKQTTIVQRVEATGSGPGIHASATYSGPPELYVNSPNKDTETYKKTIDLHGSIMTFGPGNAVQSLSISLNNEPLKIISVTEDIRFDANQIARRPVEDNKTIFDGAISLRSGINVVKITCTDRNGQKSEQSVTIIKQAKLGDIYAVVVGISKFHNPDYNLNYAASDARKFYDFLRTVSGGELPENRVRLLADSSATRANIIGTLTNLLGKATKDDTVEIYIATHGITGFDERLYYLCYDTDVENLRGTGFSDQDLTDIVNKNITAGKIIIYLDACHSGLSGLSERYAKRGIGVYEVNERINSLAAALSKKTTTGVVTFSASSSTGYSLEDPKLKGGIFTHCLINGLEGEANENNDEWVTINELDNYLIKKVKALTEGNQRPKVNTTLIEDTPLSKVR